MRNIYTGLAVLTFTTIIGCNQGTPGGPGTTGKSLAYGQADNTFNLSVPMTTSSIQQGKMTEATIGIKRAENFDEDVTLKFDDLPKGVTIEPTNPVIKHGDLDAKITFKAGDGATVGDFKVKVTGHPKLGSDAQIDFKLSVTPKESFTLIAPSQSTIKQGETQTVSIDVKRDKSFDQDILLKFGDMPTGVTLDPGSSVIKQGDSGAHITLTAANDASLGNFAIKVTGHPAKGADASNELKFVVVKKLILWRPVNINVIALSKATVSPLVRSNAMSIGSILSWIVCGLVVGICARFLVPMRQSMTLSMTAVLGIAAHFAWRILLFDHPWAVGGSIFVGQPQLVRMDRCDTGCHVHRMGVSHCLSEKMVELTLRSSWWHALSP